MAFNADLAEQTVQWFPRYLRHTKGRWAGVPFTLLDWQHDGVISPLFGTLNADGTRQFRTCYVEIPKKNGKSELAAGIALRLLFADSEPGAEIYSAACDRDQASLVFDVAAKMVQNNPKLARRCKVLESTRRIIHHNGSFYRVLSADVKTKHGINAHGVIFDELHAQPDRHLWDVLTEGTGAARRQPLIFAITTAGYDRNSICWEIHEYARKVKDRVIEDRAFLPVIYSADDEDDWTDPEVWRKCNPALDHILNIDDMASACKVAQEVPAKENVFRRFRLNQWVRQETRYIQMEKWRACGGEFNESALEGMPCYAGLDLASTTDIAAFVLMFRHEGLEYVISRFWIPDENIRDRSDRDHVPYELWVKQGYITATPGNIIDYDYIEAEIKNLAEKYQIKEIAFDRWGSVQIVTHLQEADLTVVQFGQGYKSMNPPTKSLNRAILSGIIRHGDNPVLAWMADNMVVVTDAAENVKPEKPKSNGRIDGIVAMIMAKDRLDRNEGENESVYESRGIVVV